MKSKASVHAQAPATIRAPCLRGRRPHLPARAHDPRPRARPSASKRVPRVSGRRSDFSWHRAVEGPTLRPTAPRLTPDTRPQGRRADPGTASPAIPGRQRRGTGGVTEKTATCQPQVQEKVLG